MYIVRNVNQQRMSHVITQISRSTYSLRLFWIWRNNPRARPSRSAHLSNSSQLKWSWGGPLFKIEALLAGFRSAGGIPTLTIFSSLIRTLRIRSISIITVCRVPSVIWSLGWTAAGSWRTWTGVLPRIHVTCNICTKR